jgi:hypothetical protein
LWKLLFLSEYYQGKFLPKYLTRYHILESADINIFAALLHCIHIFHKNALFFDNLQKVNLSVCMNELWFLQVWVSVHSEYYPFFILGQRQYQSVLDNGTLTCFGCLIVFSTIRKHVLFLGSYVELPVMCSFLKDCQKWGILL